jgi:hypothetical protein
MQLFLVTPDLTINQELKEDIYQSAARLTAAGHNVDMSIMENSSEQKALVSKLASSEAVLLYPGWQSNPKSIFLTDVAAKLGLPMFIEKAGKLNPRVEVIGISGYARAGKDTIGDYLVELGYIRASFADLIRQALYALNPYASNGVRVKDVIDEHGWEGSKAVDPEIRALLQRLGSDVGRSMIDNDIWVDLTLKNIPDGSKIVFTDCRFPNEAVAIKKFGGELWRVSREGAKPVNNHISETALDDWKFDAHFDNNLTIKELHEKVADKLS